MFSYLKFLALFIKIIPSIIKLHCGTKFLESLAVQSVSCFKKGKVFNSSLKDKPSISISGALFRNA